MKALPLIAAFLLGSVKAQTPCSFEDKDLQRNDLGYFRPSCTDQDRSFLLGTYISNIALDGRSSRLRANVSYVCSNGHEVFSGYNDRLEIATFRDYFVRRNEVVDNVGVSCEFNGCFVLSGFDNDDGKYLFPRTEYCYIDVDECETTVTECHSNAQCINNNTGTYYCSCNDGYLGDGVECNHIDLPDVHVTADHTRVITGSNVTLFCNTTMGFPTNYTFTWINVNTSMILGSETSDTLTLSHISEEEIATYMCQVFNLAGIVNDTITIELGVAPKAILAPNDSSPLVNGSSIDLVCEATAGDFPITLQLIHPNGSVVNQTETTEPGSFNVSIFVSADGDYGTYTCNATNIFGMDIKSVTVIKPVPPSISWVSNSSGRIVKTGEEVFLSVSISEFNLPLTSISWRHQGNKLVNDGRVDITHNTTFPMDSHPVLSTLHFYSVEPYDSGRYEIIASTSAGSEILPFTLTVIGSTKLAAIAVISVLGFIFVLPFGTMLYFSKASKKEREKIRQGAMLVESKDSELITDIDLVSPSKVIEDEHSVHEFLTNIDSSEVKNKDNDESDEVFLSDLDSKQGTSSYIYNTPVQSDMEWRSKEVAGESSYIKVDNMDFQAPLDDISNIIFTLDSEM